jgi:vacuolar-type H+-ATPase subunit H
MSAEAEAGPVTDTLEPIKRVKAVEGETLARIGEVEARLKSEVEAMAREAEAAVARARAEAEKARDALLSSARDGAESEAAKIVADGESRAKQIRSRSARELADRREALLDAVLEVFRPTRKGGA